MREPQLVEVPRARSLARPGYDGSAGVLSVGAGPVLRTLESLRAHFLSLRGFSELIFFFFFFSFRFIYEGFKATSVQKLLPPGFRMKMDLIARSSIPS